MSEATLGRGTLITGTDTGVGKTLVACALLRVLAGRGLRAIGMKPVAAGCEERDGMLVNEDVSALVAASSASASAELVNPYLFRPPVAPHLAAAREGQRISLDKIRDAYAALCRCAEHIVVEGAGGLLVPLGSGKDFRDVAAVLEIPVILVVGMRLGCLNHALLTAEAVQARGLRFAGWVANALDPGMAEFDGNLQTLRERLPAPLLGVLPYGPPSLAAAAALIGSGAERLGNLQT
jgi:dethiobiotin synthetase